MFLNLLFKKGRLSLHLLFKEQMKKIRSTLNKRRALKFPVTPKCARILVKHNGRVVFYTFLLARKGIWVLGNGCRKYGVLQTKE